LGYYRFKLELRVSPIGIITHFPLLNARAHDVNRTNSLVEGFYGLCPADKGFIDPFLNLFCLKDAASALSLQPDQICRRSLPNRPDDLGLT